VSGGGHVLDRVIEQRRFVKEFPRQRTCPIRSDVS
jgi:hypothetical protein